MSKLIMIIEDNADINDLLVKILEPSNFRTLQAFSATEANLLLEKTTPDLILLDLMLPKISGEEFLKELRKDSGFSIPVIILSAKDSLSDKINLLSLGADDYITKPFEPEEVIARILTVLRRTSPSSDSFKKLIYKNIELFPDSRKILVLGKEVSLTAHEYEILSLLLSNPDKVYTRESLYELVWKGGYYGENNTVNVHISNIRKKLKELDEAEDYIHTVYGIGFKLQ